MAGEVIPWLDTPDSELEEWQLREKYEPVTLGPTWSRNPDGSWCLPEHTIGWEILGWLAEYLHAPNGEGSFIATDEQARIVLWWYAVNEDGEFIYRTGVLQRCKGWGKDPLLAAICLVELVGPSRFSHWDDSGNPVGKPNPSAWVQVAAVSRDQTRNTMTLFPALISERMKEEYAIEMGIELIRVKNTSIRLEAVTSSYRALEGGRSSMIVENETHHWISGNQGHLMHDTIDGNATKMDGRYLAITNAYLPGEDSVAQRAREAYEKVLEGRAVETGVMYDSLEAPAHTPLDPKILPVVLDMIRGDSIWLKIDSIIKSIMTATISPARSRRMWLNQIVASEDALYEAKDWDQLRVDDELRVGDEVVLGFDGGKTDDATVLLAMRVHDGFTHPLCIEERPDGPSGDNWQVNRERVDSAVHHAFRTFKVVGFYADVNLWESNIHEWSRLYGDKLGVQSDGRNAIAWDMRQSLKKVTRAHEQLVSAILEGHVHHNGDRALRRHVLNVRRRENDYGVSFGKESRESKKKVDLYAAMMLAYTCLRDYQTRGKQLAERTGRGWFF